jgi:riboflavin synthase
VAAVRRLAVATTQAVVDRLVHEREERGEKEMREREEERARVGSSFPPVVPIDLS